VEVVEAEAEAEVAEAEVAEAEMAEAEMAEAEGAAALLAAVVVDSAADEVTAALDAPEDAEATPVPAMGAPWSSSAWTAAKLVLMPNTALKASA